MAGKGLANRSGSDPSAPARKRSKLERQRQLPIIAKMYLEGSAQWQIAEEFGLTQQQISYDLKTLRKEWFKSSIEHINQLKGKELAKVDNLEREYWDAWSRSQEDAQTHIDQDTPKGQVTTEKIEGQVGDAAFLRGVQWCIEKRCDILGLDAAAKQLNVDVAKLTDHQLERLAAGEDLLNVVANPSSS